MLKRRGLLALPLALPGCGLARGAVALLDPPGLVPWPGEPRLAHEPGAEPLAAAIAALLPAGIARAEAYHGQPYARPVLVRAFADEARFRHHSAVGPGPIGVTLLGAVHLAPRLGAAEAARLPGILGHELAHLWLHQRLGQFGQAWLPSWFQEGVAVDASGGGGAEQAAPGEARAALREGRHFAPLERVSWPLHAPGAASYGLSQHLFYRQAGEFCGWLRTRDPAAWRAALGLVAEGRGLGEAFRAALGQGPAAAFAAFRASL